MKSFLVWGMLISVRAFAVPVIELQRLDGKWQIQRCVSAFLKNPGLLKGIQGQVIVETRGGGRPAHQFTNLFVGFPAINANGVLFERVNEPDQFGDLPPNGRWKNSAIFKDGSLQMFNESCSDGGFLECRGDFTKFQARLEILDADHFEVSGSYKSSKAYYNGREFSCVFERATVDGRPTAKGK